MTKYMKIQYYSNYMKYTISNKINIRCKSKSAMLANYSFKGNNPEKLETLKFALYVSPLIKKCYIKYYLCN